MGTGQKDQCPPTRLLPPNGILFWIYFVLTIGVGGSGGQDGVRPTRLRAFWSPRSEAPPHFPTASIERVELSTEIVGIVGAVRPSAAATYGPSPLPPVPVTPAATTSTEATTHSSREDRSVGVPAIVVPANNASRGRPPSSRSWVRREAWALPLLCVSGVCFICMGSFEVWVLWEWRRRPLASSRRHLFLGQALLIGLLASTVLAGVVSLVPTPITCGAVRLGAGLAPALVFSALLVKCVFLLSLNGGVYLPAPYQASLLLFAVLVQAAIGIQWLVQHPPAVLQVLPKPLPSISPLVSDHLGLVRTDYADQSFNISSGYHGDQVPPTPSPSPNPSELFAAYRSPPSVPKLRSQNQGTGPSGFPDVSLPAVDGRPAPPPPSPSPSFPRDRLVVRVGAVVNEDKWMPRPERDGEEKARVVESGRMPPKNVRHPKREEPDEDPFPACSAPYPHLLLSLCYVACLVVTVSAASARCRRVRENRRESLYICAASLLSLPVSLAWALAGLALPPRHRDAALAAGLLATSASVFAVMFLPRGRRMAAVGRTSAPGGMSMGPGGMAVPRYGRGLTLDDDDDCNDDDDDSLSRAPSALYGARYSPSFFHFKPGGGSGKGHAPVGDGTCPSHVYKLPPSLIPSVFGDRVALVAGPPPPHLSPPNLHPPHPTTGPQALSPPAPMHLLPPPPPHPLCYPRVYHCYPYPIYPHHLHHSKSNHLSRHHQPPPKTGLYMKPEEGNVYTTLEPTLSSNPNVFFHRGGLNSGMMY